MKDIGEFIAKGSPYYADVFTESLISATDKLADFPDSGRRVPETGYSTDDIRELIFSGYRIIYHVDRQNSCVNIVTVVNSRRDLSP